MLSYPVFLAVVSRTLKHHVGEEGLAHEDAGMAGPPQSYADENPSMLGRRSVFTQTQNDFGVHNEKVTIEKQTTEDADSSKVVVVPASENEVKTVVNQPNDSQRNSSQSQTVVVNTNNVKKDTKATGNVETNQVDVKSNPRVRKHAGDEM